jgi:hypothetical protein
MLHVHLEFEPPFSFSNVSIEIQEARANTYDDMEHSWETYWVTKEEFLKCVHGCYVCDAGDQGSCSSTDPGHN